MLHQDPGPRQDLCNSAPMAHCAAMLVVLEGCSSRQVLRLLHYSLKKDGLPATTGPGVLFGQAAFEMARQEEINEMSALRGQGRPTSLAALACLP